MVYVKMGNRHLYPVSLLFSRLPYKEVQLATAVVIGERNYFGLLLIFAICTCSIIPFVCPTKPLLCITIVSRETEDNINYANFLAVSKVYCSLLHSRF